jgi:cupin 2 domain-containing protein
MNFYDYTTPKSGEDFKSFFKNESIDIVRVVSSSDLEDKLYIQDTDEFVLLLEGEATLDINGEIVTLKKGDNLFIKAKVPHRVLDTKAGTLWLAVYIKTTSSTIASH